jgi:hypothetical protein
MITMSAQDFSLQPHHIASASYANGHTTFTIHLASMTWSAKLVGCGGCIFGAIEDEYGVPLDDGAGILSWILDQPLFVMRIWELASDQEEHLIGFRPGTDFKFLF